LIPPAEENLLCSQQAITGLNHWPQSSYASSLSAKYLKTDSRSSAEGGSPVGETTAETGDGAALAANAMFGSPLHSHCVIAVHWPTVQAPVQLIGLCKPACPKFDGLLMSGPPPPYEEPAIAMSPKPMGACAQAHVHNGDQSRQPCSGPSPSDAKLRADAVKTAGFCFGAGRRAAGAGRRAAGAVADPLRGLQLSPSRSLQVTTFRELTTRPGAGGCGGEW